jgi:hypothetical protein
MKKIAFLSLFLIVNSLVFGQLKNANKYNILSGPEIKCNSSSTLKSIIKYDKTGIYTVREDIGAMNGAFGLRNLKDPEKYNTLYLEHCNNKLEIDKSVKINTEQNGVYKKLEFALGFNNQIYLFSSLKDEKQKKNILFVQSVNTTSLEVNNDSKEIAKIDFSECSNSNAGSFGYKISRDSSKLLIYADLPCHKKEKAKIGCTVLDNSMKEVWKKQITFPYEDEEFNVTDYKVDNQGNIHVLAVVDKEKQKGEADYKYDVLSYYNNGTDLSEYAAELKGKYIGQMKIEVTDDAVVCSGFYSNKNHGAIIRESNIFNTIRGTYFLKIDKKTKNVVSEKSKDFSVELLGQNLSEKEQKKLEKKDSKGKDVEIAGCYLKDLVIKDDGGVVLVGEQSQGTTSKNSTTTTTDGITGSTEHTTTVTSNGFLCNDIVVINISKDGEVSWGQKISKKQLISADYLPQSSYCLSIVKNKVCIIFNDNPKNIDNKPGDQILNYYGYNGIPILIMFDDKGKQTREALLETKKEVGVLVEPALSKQVAPNQVVLFGQKGKTQKFFKLTFK